MQAGSLVSKSLLDLTAPAPWENLDIPDTLVEQSKILNTVCSDYGEYLESLEELEDLELAIQRVSDLQRPMARALLAYPAGR